MFITFEGIDGSGKTTQLQLLAKYLQSKGYDVLVLREPGGVPLSESIRNILLNSVEDINPLTELLLFEASRSHLVHTIIQPALASGRVVLCDRYFDSTTAYQGYGRGLDIEMIAEFNSIATMGIIPDLTFYLDIEVSEAELRSERKIYDRIESSGTIFYSKVIAGFRDLAAKHSQRIKLIDSSQELSNTSRRIISIVDNFLLSNS